MVSSISGGGLFTNSYAQALTQMRRSFDDLSLQLATGMKSQTYAGLGSGRGVALTLRGKIADIESYKNNIQQVSLRTSMMGTSLSSLVDIGNATKSDLDPSTFLLAGTRTVSQQSAETRLDQAVEALNGNVAGVYLFGGRNVTTRPVASSGDILNGTAGRAGLKTAIAERKIADMGADGRGRLTQATATGDTVNLAETAATNAFGFKIGTVASTNSAAFTITGPAGSPPAASIEVSGDPEPGATVRVTLDMPDGTSTEIALVAQDDAPFSGDVARVTGKTMPTGTDTDTVLGDPLLGMAVGNVIRINGQEIEVVASGAGAGEINVTATLDDLLTQIEGLTGVASAVYDPDTRKVRLTGDTGVDLDISGTVATRLGLTGQHQTEQIQSYEYRIAYDGSGNVDRDATAANMAAALDEAVKHEAKTALVAASALEASEGFFGDPPQRVDGAPATATALRDGSADTVQWYRGDNGAGSARETQSARIDSSITANYGARASEDGIRGLLINLGAVAAMQLDVADTGTAKEQYAELITRARPALASDTGLGQLESIVISITNVEAQVQAASKRHVTSDAVAKTMLADVEGVDKEEVAASLLALQTNLSASYQVTSMASQLSLVNFL